MSPALPKYDRTMSIQRRQTAPDRALNDTAHVLGGRDRSVVFQEGKGQRLRRVRDNNTSSIPSETMPLRCDEFGRMKVGPSGRIETMEERET